MLSEVLRRAYAAFAATRTSPDRPGFRRQLSLQILAPRLLLAVDGFNGELVAEGEAGENARPDFSLIDQNSTSPTWMQPVSPRDYLDQVSAWYFGHAT